jgi:protein-S-isoprenylcysteine O-methyltransferase Ste14
MLNMTKPDSPGIQFPPPLLYAAVFFGGIFLQKILPIRSLFFDARIVRIVAILLFLVALFFSVRSMSQFVRTKNTIIPNKAAQSLQTTGIYHLSRNPMYFSLGMFYLGLTCLFGNWWNIILVPLLVVMVQEFVIKQEEKYLTRKFGEEFNQYKQKVRRWL